ncbi:GNAT family N-acetyltransferase [candidate division WOR-3 bacterium]|nr:GNAT family N-acetyltransferase [candidate division WOR-3 bacterium]
MPPPKSAVNGVEYKIRPKVADAELNELFASAWEGHVERMFGPVLQQGLTYVCAYAGTRLVGFVNVAWDGGVHGFILDTTVHRDYQRRGIGTELVRQAAEVAAELGLAWLHVDCEAELEAFYRGCGFKQTKAGLLRLRNAEERA